MRELRNAARLLVRQPAFSLVAVATLGLGISASVAVFAIIDALLLRPLPYPEAQRIVSVEGPGPQAFVRFRRSAFDLAYPEMAQSPVFGAMGLYVTGGLNLGSDPAERISGAAVTPGFFAVLGVRPAAGRLLADSDLAGDRRIAVVSDRLWARRLGRGPVLGRTIALNGVSYTVVGVLPPRAGFPNNSDVWILTGAERVGGDSIASPRLIARLGAAATPSSARDEVGRILAAYGTTRRSSAPGGGVRVQPLRDSLVGGLKPLLLLLASSAGLVLLVACANTSHLLLARTATRHHELFVLRALGASPWRLAWRLGAESLLLSAASGALAMPGVIAMLAPIRRLLPATLDGTDDIAFGHRSLGALLVVIVATAVISSLPLCWTVFSARSTSYPSSERQPAGLWRQLRGGLVVGEIAMALVLLLGSLTLTSTVARVRNVDLGVHGTGSVALRLNLPTAVYGTGNAVRRFLATLESRLRDDAGVEAIGVTDRLFGPLDNAARIQPRLEERPEGESGDLAVFLRATPGYFAATGVAFVAGRSFSGAETLQSPRVAIVSAAFAKRLGLAPPALLGRRVNVETAIGEFEWAEVVGVVQDVRLAGPEGETPPSVYVPYAQSTPVLGTLNVVVKVAGPLSPAAMETIRKTVARVDPTVPAHGMESLENLKAQFLADRARAMVIISGFGAFAFGLANLGLYGMVTYLVRMRRRELGIRLALGASPRQVLVALLASGLRYGVCGVMLGGILATFAARIVRATVPGLTEIGFPAFAALAASLVAVALIATWVPAQLATRVNPADVLRAE